MPIAVAVLAIAFLVSHVHHERQLAEAQRRLEAQIAEANRTLEAVVQGAEEWLRAGDVRAVNSIQTSLGSAIENGDLCDDVRRQQASELLAQIDVEITLATAVDLLDQQDDISKATRLLEQYTRKKAVARRQVAERLLAEVGVATSPDKAFEKLVAMSDEAFLEFQGGGQAKDERVTHPYLTRIHADTLQHALPKAEARREEKQQRKLVDPRTYFVTKSIQKDPSTIKNPFGSGIRTNGVWLSSFKDPDRRYLIVLVFVRSDLLLASEEEFDRTFKEMQKMDKLLPETSQTAPPSRLHVCIYDAGLFTLTLKDGREFQGSVVAPARAGLFGTSIEPFHENMFARSWKVPVSARKRPLAIGWVLDKTDCVGPFRLRFKEGPLLEVTEEQPWPSG